MRNTRTLVVMSLFIFSPCWLFVAVQLVFLWFPLHLDPLFILLLLLSPVYFLFLMIFAVIPEKLMPYYVAFYGLAYMICLGTIIFMHDNSPPGWEGIFLNIYAIPSFSIFVFLSAAGLGMAVLLLIMRVDRRTALMIFVGIMLLSSLFCFGKSVWHRRQIAGVLGPCRQGEIFFVSPRVFSSGDDHIVFDLAQLSFGRAPRQEFERLVPSSEVLSPDGQHSVRYDKETCRFFIVDTGRNERVFAVQHWLWDVQWSPDSKFIVYDYAYDRDDFYKIFLANAATGKTVLLAAGRDPIWHASGPWK